MIDGAVGNPPEAYLKLIKPLIDVARSLLEKGEALASIAFVGNLGTGKTMQILLDSESDDNKDHSAMAVRMNLPSSRKSKDDFPASFHNKHPLMVL